MLQLSKRKIKMRLKSTMMLQLTSQKNKKEDTIVKANTTKLKAEEDNTKYKEKFNKAHNDGVEKLRQIDAVAKAAQADVVMNEKAQMDSVASSAEEVESVKKNAQRTYKSDYETQMAEAKETESIADARFKSLTNTMESSCKSQGGLLADEKLTLELVMDKIHSLVTVKSNVVGAQGDATTTTNASAYTTTTTTAPTAKIIEVKTFTIGSKTYNQCKAKCNSKGMNLASKKQLLNFFTLPGGGPRKQSGDVWTPVFGANDWLQLGNRHWPFGKLHTEIAGGKHKKPGWGNQELPQSFKRNFYCTK